MRSVLDRNVVMRQMTAVKADMTHTMVSKGKDNTVFTMSRLAGFLMVFDRRNVPPKPASLLESKHFIKAYRERGGKPVKV